MRTYVQFTLVAALITAGCGLQKTESPSTDAISASTSTDPTTLSPLGQQAYAVLQTNCASCHGPGSPGSGGINYILDFNSLISNGLAVPGNAAGSTIYADMKNGVMPPGGGISSTDLQTIFNWIQTDLKAGGPQPSPSPTPSSLPTSTPSSTPLAATFTSINANILTPYCIGCHGSKNPASGVSYSSFTATLKTVTAGSPSQSKLYSVCNNGSMPQGGPKLTTAELQAISTWITNGAMNN